MWIELPNLWIATINCLGIPTAHLLIAWLSTLLPSGTFRPEGFLFRTRSWERGGFLYERVFHVRRWKHHLPDAAPWFKGFAKGRLSSTDPDYLRTFITEACRGELSHWLQVIAISSFVIITPYPASLIIIAYSLVSNLPCIINLRHTRIRLKAVFEKSPRGETANHARKQQEVKRKHRQPIQPS